MSEVAYLHTPTPADLILSRLENVQKYRDGWTACCPLHESKSRSSLHITALEDGTILMNDFAGCGTADILHHIGLGLKDLYPQELIVDRKPLTRFERKQAGQMAKWKAAQPTLLHAAKKIWVAGQQIRAGHPLNDVDAAQLDSALETIEDVIRVLNGYD